MVLVCVDCVMVLVLVCVEWFYSVCMVLVCVECS